MLRHGWLKNGLIVGCVVAMVAMGAQRASAVDEGQDDLDRATEAKLLADSIADLERVVMLLERALDKGLNEGNAEFAIQLLVSTLYQEAEFFSSRIFEQTPPDPLWPQLRDVSLRLLAKAIDHDDQFASAYLLVARLQELPGGDHDKAVEAVEKTVDLYDDDDHPGELSQALVLRGNLTLDDEDARLEDYIRAIELDPRNGTAWRSRGMLYLLMEENEKALADFLHLLELDPTDVTSHQAVAEVLAGDEKYEEALEYLDKAIELDPESGIGYTFRARMHVLNDDMESALADTNKAIELNPRDLAARLLRARLNLFDEDWVKAKDDVDWILRRQPGMPEAVLLRSMIYAATEHWDRAIADMLQLIQLDPESVEMRLQLAAYYQASDRPRKAIELYNDILEDEPGDTDVLQGRADALLGIGEHESAIADYELALENDPDNDGILNNFAWVLATSTIDEVRDGEHSLELALRACEVTEYEESHILSTLAAAYAETGDFEKAREWAAKAVELGQEDRPDIVEQLEQELASYEKEEPWRELQETEEAEDPEEPGDGDLNVF